MGGAKEPDANSGGLMDVSGMAEMQAAIAAELKSKYEEKIRTLQAKIVQAEKKRKQEEHARRQQNTDDIKKAMEAAAKAAEKKLKRKEEQIAKKNERLKEMKKRQQDMAKKAATELAGLFPDEPRLTRPLRTYVAQPDLTPDHESSFDPL